MNTGVGSNFEQVDRATFDAFVAKHDYVRDHWSNASHYIVPARWGNGKVIIATEFTDGRLFIMGDDFATIWEKDAKWFTRPNFLADVVHLFKGKSLVFIMGGRDEPNSATITLPESEATNALFPFVPDPLKEIFRDRLLRAVVKHAAEIGFDFEALCGPYKMAATAVNQAMLNNHLQMLEQQMQARGETELWQRVAIEFGLDPVALPKALGVSAL